MILIFYAMNQSRTFFYAKYFCVSVMMLTRSASNRIEFRGGIRSLIVALWKQQITSLELLN